MAQNYSTDVRAFRTIRKVRKGCACPRQCQAFYWRQAAPILKPGSALGFIFCDGPMQLKREPHIAGEMGIRARRHESQEARCGHPPVRGGFILWPRVGLLLFSLGVSRSRLCTRPPQAGPVVPPRPLRALPVSRSSYSRRCSMATVPCRLRSTNGRPSTATVPEKSPNT